MVDVNARVSQSDKGTFSNQELRNTSRNRGSVSPMFVTSSAGLSKAGLARLHDVMASFVERREVPGLVTLVNRRGETHVEALGMKALGGSEPVQRHTIFRISSMTKPITAAAAMILVEECKLRLDDPVDALLPELADRQVLRRLDAPLDDTEPARRAITLRDLLTLRMGFGIVMAPPGTYPIQTAVDDLQLGQGFHQPSLPPGPDEWIRRLGTLPLMHQPGEKWLYHTGFDALGVLIARASGQPFETFLQERIFEPLGMKDTAFSAPASKADRLATAYLTNSDIGALELYDPAEGGRWSRSPAFPSGSVGLVSTVDDYLAFARMMLNQGRYRGRRILSRPSVETMTVDHLTAAQKAVSGLISENSGWGFGVAVVTRRDHVSAPVGSYGWAGGLGTSWRSDPSEDMVVILLTQASWTSLVPGRVSRDFGILAYQAIDD
jgi:CubicO group peptidase (beta-lactamase class C family)